jgi:hypothetical protein
MPVQQGDGSYDGPPRLYYFNGKKYDDPEVPDRPGSFYISEKELRGFVPGDPWKRQPGRFGGKEVGYTTSSLGLIFICRRSQPFADLTAEGKVIGREWHPEYIRAETPRPWPVGVTQPSKSVYTEYLVLPDGFYDPENLGEAGVNIKEAVWAVKGWVGMRMNEMLKEYEASMLTAAQDEISRLQGKPAGKPAWFTFRVTAQPEFEYDKKRNAEVPLFSHNKTYNIYFNLPVLQIVEPFTSVEMDQLYVGDEMLSIGETLFDQYAEWRKTRRGSAPTAAESQEAQGQQKFDYEDAREAVTSRSTGVASRPGPFGAGDSRTLTEEMEADDIPF